MRTLVATLALVTAAGCTCGSRAEEPGTRSTAALPCPLPAPTFADDEHAAELLAEARWRAALDAFDVAFEAGRDAEALGCAQEAARLYPDDTLGHLNRGLALDALGDDAAAHEAYLRAVAIDPDDPEALRGLADFLERTGNDDGLHAAIRLARRGREASRDNGLSADLALVEARAANALGRSEEALGAAETALTLDDRPLAHLERGIALFELLRFEDADRALTAARNELPTDARAAHWSALLAERLGRDTEAHALFAKAAELDPDTYPPTLDVAPTDFETLLAEERAALPETMRKALDAASVSAAELPALDDLQGAEPALSPTILGLFRPAETPEGRSAIILYRRNLLRIVRTHDELRREVRDTLLHELGHLGGENDAELHDRGL